MALCSFLFRCRRLRHLLCHHQRGLLFLPFSLLMCMLLILTAVVMMMYPSWTNLHYIMLSQNPKVVEAKEMIFNNKSTVTNFQFEAQAQGQVKAGVESAEEDQETPIPTRDWKPLLIPSPHQIQDPATLPSEQQLKFQRSRNTSSVKGPYHNWEIFSADYQEMLHNLKIFVYPDVYPKGKEDPSSPASSYESIFLPLANPMNPKLGNYFSEHAFKVALLQSSLFTKRPEEASFFFMPFSINAMRNHPLLHSESSISDFIAQYTHRISLEFTYWNASAGADHFYVYCHSVGRDAASKHSALHNNAIQVTCSSSYFQKLYITHKDIGLPQVWPRKSGRALNPPNARNILVFFAGRAQNSHVRQKILDLWANDTSFVISSKVSSLPYEEGFRRSMYCLHVRGYEVNTARVSDAIHHGCIPVIISNYYDLPFANVLDWSEFSVIICEADISVLKKILLSVSKETYLRLYKNLSFVRRHFAWHTTPRNYDAFYMTAYQLWLKRGVHRVAYL